VIKQLREIERLKTDEKHIMVKKSWSFDLEKVIKKLFGRTL